MDPGAIQMGMAAEPSDLFDWIARCRPCSEGGACDINGIGTTVDGCDADFRISRRCEKLKVYLHLSWVIW